MSAVPTEGGCRGRPLRGGTEREGGEGASSSRGGLLRDAVDEYLSMLSWEVGLCPS